MLGEVRIRTKDFAGARAAIEKALAAEPKFVTPYLTLIRLDLTENRMEDSLQSAGRVLKLVPDLPEAHFYRGLALTSLGRADEAESSLKVVEASGEAKRFPRTHFMLGNLLLSRGDIPGAASQFRKFLVEEPDSRAAEAVRAQLEKWRAEGSLQ